MTNAHSSKLTHYFDKYLVAGCLPAALWKEIHTFRDFLWMHNL